MRSLSGVLHRRWLPTATWLAAFVVLTVLVRLGAFDAWDVRIASWVRPDGVWGDLQIQVDRVVEGLSPPVLAGVVLVAALLAAVRDRSWLPLLVTALVTLVTATATVLVQWAVARPDPHGVVHSFGGSYPSGHTAAAVVSAALVTHLLSPTNTSVAAAAAVGGAVVMGGALVVQVAHWPTDVLGGCLLGAVVDSALRAAGGLRLLSVSFARRPVRDSR